MRFIVYFNGDLNTAKGNKLDIHCMETRQKKYNFLNQILNNKKHVNVDYLYQVQSIKNEFFGFNIDFFI